METKLKKFWNRNKLPVITACIVLCVFAWTGIQKITAKYPALYVAFVNISASEDLVTELTDGFLQTQNLDAEKFQVTPYTGLYLTDDSTSEFYEYSHASSIKILGSIDTEAMDIVLMNKEAFDAFAQNGYLVNLDTFLEKGSPLREYLVDNIVILEDNIDEVAWDDSVKYSAVTEEFPMALDMSSSPFFAEAGLDGTVYLGIIGNSPRLEMAGNYISYLFP